VLLIYRLIHRMHGLLGYIAIFGTTRISHFFETFFFHGYTRHENVCFCVLVDRYALYCFACKIWRWVVYLVPEKKATLYKKKRKSKVHIFQFSKTFHTPPIEKRADHSLGKSLIFFRSLFSCERDRQPTIKFDIDLVVLLIYRLILRKPGWREWIEFFDITPINRFLQASFSVHDSTQRRRVCFWASVNRYAFHGVACKIWRWVVFVSPAKWATPYQKKGSKVYI
jgi:hypothetical protein